jgi:hypothetical protein
MKSLYILLVAIAVCTVSCRTKEGAPGPSGESTLTQQGTISGSLAYVDYQGNPISVPFSYSYFASLAGNKFSYDENGKKNYLVQLFRRDLKDNNNYIGFYNLLGYNVNNQFNAPSSGDFDFSLVKIINNNLFEFNAYFYSTNTTTLSTYTITNYNLNATTGRLTFDFEIVFDPNSIDDSVRYNYEVVAIVTGKVDVILNRTPLYSVSQ